MTPFSPFMKGIVMPKYSRKSRFTLPFAPNRSCIATAPMKGGMMSGTKASVWMMTEPEKLNRVVK